MLVDEGLLTERDRRTIKRNCGYGSAAFAKSVVACGIMDESELASFLAEKTQNELASKDLQRDTSTEAMGSVDHPLLERLEVIPVEVQGKILKVAMADPLDHDTISQLEFFTGYKVKPVIATFSQIFEGLKDLINEFQPQLTSLEKFLHNHATPASKRLKIVQGASVADTPQITNEEIPPIKAKEPQIEFEDEVEIEEDEVDEDAELDGDEDFDEFEEEVDEFDQEEDEEDAKESGTKDRYGDFASVEDDDDEGLDIEEDQGEEESNDDSSGFDDFDAVESLDESDSEGDSDEDLEGLGDSFSEGELDEAGDSQGEVDEIAALAAETFEGAADDYTDPEFDDGLTAKNAKASTTKTNKPDSLDDFESAIDDDLNIAMSDDDIASDLSALGGFAANAGEVVDLGADPLAIEEPAINDAQESVESSDDFDLSDLDDVAISPQADQAFDSLNEITTNAEADPSEGSLEDLGDLEALGNEASDEGANLETTDEDFNDLDGFDEGDSSATEEVTAASETDELGDLDDLGSLDSLDEMGGMEGAFEQHDATLNPLEDDGPALDPPMEAPPIQQTAALLESSDEMKRLTMRAIGSLNKVLLKLSLKTDMIDIIHMVGEAFSHAGITRGIVIENVDGQLSPKVSWELDEEQVLVIQDGLESYVTEGLPNALERLFPGWTTFDDATRASNMVPFDDWVDEGTQLAAAMLPAGEKQIALIVAWQSPYCESEGIRGAALELSRRFVKKI
jgi:hypothetical protein